MYGSPLCRARRLTLVERAGGSPLWRGPYARLASMWRAVWTARHYAGAEGLPWRRGPEAHLSIRGPYVRHASVMPGPSKRLAQTKKAKIMARFLLRNCSRGQGALAHPTIEEGQGNNGTPLRCFVRALLVGTPSSAVTKFLAAAGLFIFSYSEFLITS